MNNLEKFRLAAEERKRKKEENKKPMSPKTQNMTVGEAFKKAVEQKPDSPIAPIIKNVNRTQAVEEFKQREKNRFDKVRKEYNNLGRMWYETEIDQFTSIYNRQKSIPIDQKRKQWREALTSLRDRPSEQRVDLLNELASGMQLEEDKILPMVGLSPN